MLFEACAACLRFWMSERGRGGGDGRREEGVVGMGGGHKSEHAANSAKEWWVFYSIFSNVTYCYTAVGRLIHNSVGLQYQKGNYGGIFFFFLLSLAVTHHWIRRTSVICKVLHEENPFHEYCTCPKNINNLLVESWQNKHLTDFFSFLESYSRGSARCIILLQFSSSSLVVWFMLCSLLWCVVRSLWAAPVWWRIVTLLALQVLKVDFLLLRLKQCLLNWKL